MSASEEYFVVLIFLIVIAALLLPVAQTGGHGSGLCDVAAAIQAGTGT